jgi:hypothetical protein
MRSRIPQNLSRRRSGWFQVVRESTPAGEIERSNQLTFYRSSSQDTRLADLYAARTCSRLEGPSAEPLCHYSMCFGTLLLSSEINVLPPDVGSTAPSSRISLAVTALW